MLNLYSLYYRWPSDFHLRMIRNQRRCWPVSGLNPIFRGSALRGHRINETADLPESTGPQSFLDGKSSLAIHRLIEYSGNNRFIVVVFRFSSVADDKCLVVGNNGDLLLHPRHRLESGCRAETSVAGSGVCLSNHRIHSLCFYSCFLSPTSDLLSVSAGAYRQVTRTLSKQITLYLRRVMFTRLTIIYYM